MSDLIERQVTIDALMEDFKRIPTNAIRSKTVIEQLPSAHSERLTDDDFETIRIHLNAQKERLCNQQRWEEADEYQRIIDRFMAFASAQPEIVRCKDCKFWREHKYAKGTKRYIPFCGLNAIYTKSDDFCSKGERRTDE